MMRSLYSGVAGLKTHQVKMDVIGNNIANVNTTSYKSQSITFSDLLYQTTQSASGANATTGVGGTNARQIGLGSKSGAISTAITTQGSAQSTSNPFDIMITGDSFFVVSNGKENFFTRDGSFAVDGMGNLVMSTTGYNVMGWQSDKDGNIIQNTVSPLKVMAAENLTFPPEATTQAYVSGILDKNDTNVSSTDGKVVGLSFYDNLGYKYNARFRIHEVNGDKGEYYVTVEKILDADGNEITNAKGVLNTADITVSPTDQVSRGEIDDTKYAMVSYTTPAGKNVYGIFDKTTLVGGGVTYKADGTLDQTDLATTKTSTDLLGLYKTAVQDEYNTAEKKATNATFDPETGILSVDYDLKVGNSMCLKYDPTSGAFAGIGESFGSITKTNNSITMSFNPIGTATAGNFENVTIDWSTSTMYNNNGTSTISATSGDAKGLGTGRKVGEMSGISVSKDGIITATYDNGQNRVLGQIAVANFANASGLEKAGDNLYSATANSGEFNGIGEDITAGGNYMTTGVLEMSNVDLAQEFTDMITTQRGFQANSRIITVSDTLLEELTNLKR